MGTSRPDRATHDDATTGATGAPGIASTSAPTPVVPPALANVQAILASVRPVLSADPVEPHVTPEVIEYHAELSARLNLALEREREAMAKMREIKKGFDETSRIVSDAEPAHNATAVALHAQLQTAEVQVRAQRESSSAEAIRTRERIRQLVNLSRHELDVAKLRREIEGHAGARAASAAGTAPPSRTVTRMTERSADDSVNDLVAAEANAVVAYNADDKRLVNQMSKIKGLSGRIVLEPMQLMLSIQAREADWTQLAIDRQLWGFALGNSIPSDVSEGVNNLSLSVEGRETTWVALTYDQKVQAGAARQVRRCVYPPARTRSVRPPHV